jgi:cell division protein FtsQ
MGRALPGMPPDFDDPEDDGEPRLTRRRPSRDKLGKPRGRWWLPASKTGRIALALSAILVLVAFCTVSFMLKHYLERDSRFRIAGGAGIQATGLAEVSRSQMLPVFGEDIGRNIFFVPLDARRKELERIPWIERATVMRVLPDQIRVSVVERKPVAFTRIGHEIGLVDANGVLLTMSPATMAARHYSFPVVTGIDPVDSPDSRKGRMATYLRLMTDLDSTGHRYSEQISEIDLTDPEDARVLMPAQGADILAHFGDDHFLDRYLRYQAHIAEWRQQYPHLASVDLRFSDQVILQMASGKDASAGDPGSGAAAPRSGASSASNASPSDQAKSSESNSSPNGPAAKKPKPAHKKHAAAKRAAIDSNRRNSASQSHLAAAAVSGNEQGQ